jgi:hypothetical protein
MLGGCLLPLASEFVVAFAFQQCICIAYRRKATAYRLHKPPRDRHRYRRIFSHAHSIRRCRIQICILTCLVHRESCLVNPSSASISLLRTAC